MAGLQLEENLEKLSEALVFAEPADPKSLADLHTQFETIGELAEDELFCCENHLTDRLFSVEGGWDSVQSSQSSGEERL